MPIYEYECEKCGKIIEVMQKFSDAPLSECECHGSLRKLISSSSFHLKGSGWYVTDYKGKNAGSQAPAKDSGESKPSAPAESKSSDSKTD